MKFSARLLVALFFAYLAAAFPAAAQTVVTLYSQYNAPQYVAVDANRTVFVTDTTNSLSGLGLTNTGVYAATPAPYDTNFDTLYESPEGVAVGPNGLIFSVSQVSSAPGQFFLFVFGPPNYAEIVDGILSSNGGAMQGVALDSQANFFVADTNGTVFKIYASSGYVEARSFGTGQGGTDHPFGIAFDSHDHLFVADQRSGSGQILEFAAAGDPQFPPLLNTITNVNVHQPAGVAVDTRDNLYVTDSVANTLTEFAAPDYTTAQVIVSTGLSGPMGVALDADDNIFVVDTGHNALKEVLALPAVTAVAAPAGPLGGGNPVTITGVHLTGASAVAFGGTAATSFQAVSDTEVTATAPPGSAGPVDIRVTTPNGTSIVVPADAYTYTPAPAVGSVNRPSGPTAGGNLVAITGTNLAQVSAVSFGGTPAASFLSLGNTLLSAAVPPGAAGTVDVTVTTPGGTSATGANDQYTYVAQPVVTGVGPGAGPTAGGTSVTITGTHLTGALSASFAGTSVPIASIVSDSEVTATAPPGAAGTVDVTVTTAGGPSATSAADAYIYVAAPNVAGLTPASGPTGGGTPVIISGTNLAGASAVTFGATAATGFVVNSASKITAIAPPGSVGAVDVTVTTAGGTSATGAADQYSYTLAPSVTAISPAGGPTSGGNMVTITGANLGGATSVRFGGNAATNVVAGTTQVTATAPAGAAGLVDVTVTTPNGTSATSAADSYTYAAPPTVTGLTPSSGSTGGGTVVIVTGSNLTGASAVKFGTTAATSFTVNNAGQITAVAPAGSAGIVDITVTTLGGTSATGAPDQYSYTLTPAVSSISPSAGPVAGGTAVTITGANLTGATAVRFGGNAATNVMAGTTQVTATAPAGAAGLVDVTVTTPNGTSATVAADGYTYVAAPAVTGVSPSSGSTGGGTLVTITGSNFSGASTVMFGTAPASGFTLVSATQIKATSPAAAAGAVDITVTTLGGTSATGAADLYTYLALPTVTALSPVTGPVGGGTSVVITGTNLTGATAVKFGTASASFTVNSATQITAASPAGSAGAVDVTVTTPSGASATGPADQFTYGNGPTVGSVSPANGPTSGSTAVTITGANLGGATAVTFGTVPAASFTVANATTITAFTPAETASTVDVTVTTPVGTSAANPGDRFTFGGLPVVTALKPTSGPTTGGTAVTISGANFTGATAVTFGTTAATNVVVVSASQLTATAPAGSAAGLVDVTVTTPIGTSATSVADGYTYTAVPSVTALSPALGPISGGTSVTITGANLTGATAVRFGTVAAGFTVASATQITATAPPEAVGTVDVTVTNSNGTSSVNIADRFTYTALPIVTALSPNSGSPAGGTMVTITGANLTGATSVKFGGAAVAGFTVNGTTQITATAPAGMAGTIDVTVTAPNGTSAASAADRFTYAAGTAGQAYVYQSTLGVPGVAGPDTSHFNLPVVGAVDIASGHLFVADAGNHRVQVLDTGTLAVVATIGISGVAGSDNAHLNGPLGVGFDAANGHVLVADTGNDRVQIFDAGSFAYLATLGVAGAPGSDNGHFNVPAGIHPNPTTRELYIADSGNHRVQVFDAGTLGYIGTIGVAGVPGGDNLHLDLPMDAELDPAANQIMVADSLNGRVQLFDAGTLAYAGTLGGGGAAPADNDFLGTPVTAAFDPASNLVLVADASPDSRVQVFDAMTYGYVLTLGTTGSSGAGNTQFAGPSGIAADPVHARLFVGDKRNDRVQVFQIAAPTLFAAVLPGSRSVQLGNPATLFASMINAGTMPLQNCGVALPVTAPSGLTLSYQTTNPATNALTGTANTPAMIAGGNGVQSFLVSFQGEDAFSAAALPIDFDCAGVAPAAVTTGVDTVDLTLSATPVADIIALAATPTGNGIVEVPVGGAAAFAVATSNVGVGSLIIASVDTGAATLPLTAAICPSNAATGQCLVTPAASVPLTIAAGAAPTFSVFLGASGPIPLDPAASRLFVRFKDAGGNFHGSTSVAVQAE